MPRIENKIARRFAKLWRQGLPPHSLAAYGFAVGCVAAASLCRLAFELIVSSVALFVLYIPAILVASLVGGLSAGMVAVLLGGLAAWLGLLSPSFVLAAPTLPQSVGLAAYAVSGSLVACVAEAYRRAVRQAYEQQRMRLLLIREIQHRNKNLLATVQAIVMQTLRENRPDAERINGRINALAATDDILTRSSNQTADLKEILSHELRPYGERRVALQGGTVHLAPELAKALALVAHELATNAAKYGALSTPEGGLSVGWLAWGGRVQITWAERGGPLVSPPLKLGFGTSLIQRLLDGYQGTIQIEFPPDGVLCKISFALSDPPRLPHGSPSPALLFSSFDGT